MLQTPGIQQSAINRFNPTALLLKLNPTALLQKLARAFKFSAIVNPEVG